MMPTAASPCLYRKWKAFDSPLAFLWLLCLKSVQVCSPHPQSVVTNKWNKHPVVTLTVKNHLSLCGLPAYWLAWWTLELTTSVACAPPVELQQAQSVGHSAPSPAPLNPTSHSSLNLGFTSDHTRHGHVLLWRGRREPLGLSVSLGELIMEREAGLPGTVGIEQREELRAQSIKTELFALWE